jgi:hypothetical protein
VTDDRLGIGVAMMRVFKYGPVFEQVAKSALSKLVGMAAQQVTPKLVHRDLQDEPGRFAATLARRTAGACQRQEESDGGPEWAAPVHDLLHRQSFENEIRLALGSP